MTSEFAMRGLTGVAVNNDQLLWVQVRADSTAAANRVLDGVEVHGM